MKMSYDVASENIINIYGKVNISDLAVNLSSQNCIINEFQEKEETLESYYINLMGGNKNV